MISSRTPEGDAHRCPICGDVAALEPSYPGGDSCCPKCGRLLWWFRDNYARLGFDAPDHIRFDLSLFDDPIEDSLDVVEIIMEMEEHFNISIPEDDALKIRTIGDAIRSIRRRQTG